MSNRTNLHQRFGVFRHPQDTSTGGPAFISGPLRYVPPRDSGDWGALAVTAGKRVAELRSSHGPDADIRRIVRNDVVQMERAGRIPVVGVSTVNIRMAGSVAEPIDHDRLGREQWATVMAGLQADPRAALGFLAHHRTDLLEGLLGQPEAPTVPVQSLDPPADAGPAADAAWAGPQPAQAHGSVKMTWQQAQGQLLRKRERDEPFTSLRVLAEELGCSPGTVMKAVKRSDSLRGWRKRAEGEKARPPAVSLDERTRVPSDKLEDSDPSPSPGLDEVWADASPPRADLTTQPERSEETLARLTREQDDDWEPSPLEPDVPGRARRKVREHKRA